MNDIMKCVAIDDEPIALSILSEYCNRHGGLTLQTFTSPSEGLEYVLASPPDILFLDIEMNSRNGLQLASELPPGICLIFTTAYQQYALDGFNLDAVDFLHKPIFFPRFEQAIAKAVRRLNRPDADTHSEAITLKVEHRTVLIRPEEILYIEAMDNYVKVFRLNQPTILSQITMKEMMAKLPSKDFARVHRSYIVALKGITGYACRRLTLRGTTQEIPIGRKYADTIAGLIS